MHKIKAVLFDLDGVLVDACEWHYESLNAALLSADLPIISKSDHHKHYNGLPTRIKLQKIGYPSDLVQLINKKKQELMLETINAHGSESPEKIELLSFLRNQNIKIACVTNSIHKTARKMLEITGQLPYIDCLVTNQDITAPKPSPEGYLKAMEILGVSAEECICVEDSEYGRLAAYAASPRGVWCVDGIDCVTIQGLAAWSLGALT